jgi:hypothetical protein
MTDIKITLEGNISDCFAHGIGRIDNMGAVTRITFYVPVRFNDELLNEAVFRLIVPTDQLGKIAAALVQQQPSIIDSMAREIDGVPLQ